MKRVILIVISVISLLVSLPLLLAGVVFTAVGSGEDPTVDGRIGQVDSSGYAVVSDTLDVDWDYPLADRFDITLGARSARPQTAVFIGYGPAAAVDAYLSGVPQTIVYSIGDATRVDREVQIPGSTVPERPGEQDFWVEQASGTGLQQVPIAAQTGSYRLVVMNAEASRGVDVEVFGSMTLPYLLPVGIGMLLLGLLFLAVAIGFLIWGIRSRPAPAPAPMGYPYWQPTAPGVPQQPPGGGPYGPPAQYSGPPFGASLTPPVPPSPPVGGMPQPGASAPQPPGQPGGAPQTGPRDGEADR